MASRSTQEYAELHYLASAALAEVSDLSVLIGSYHRPPEIGNVKVW